MNEQQIRNGLRKHWFWLKKGDRETVAEFVIAHGRRGQEDGERILWETFLKQNKAAVKQATKKLKASSKRFDAGMKKIMEALHS